MYSPAVHYAGRKFFVACKFIQDSLPDTLRRTEITLAAVVGQSLVGQMQRVIRVDVRDWQFKRWGGRLYENLTYSTYVGCPPCKRDRTERYRICALTFNDVDHAILLAYGLLRSNRICGTLGCKMYVSPLRIA